MACIRSKYPSLIPKTEFQTAQIDLEFMFGDPRYTIKFPDGFDWPLRQLVIMASIEIETTIDRFFNGFLNGTVRAGTVFFLHTIT